MIRLTFELVGTGAILRHCAAQIRARGHQVSAVFTDDEATATATMEELGSDAKPVAALETPGAGVTCDVLLSVGNLKKLPASVLARAGRAAVNYHDGPLPRYPGLNAPSWALAASETAHGISWHLMTAGVDAGIVLVQRRFLVETDDTSFTLGARCYEAAVGSFPELLNRLEWGDLDGYAYPLEEASRHLASDRPALFGILDWSKDATALVDLGRALDFGPYTNPLCLPKLVVGDTVIAARRVACVASSGSHDRPGRVQQIDEQGWQVSCGHGEVRVSEFHAADGEALTGFQLATLTGTGVGRILQPLAPSAAAAIEDLVARLVTHEPFWSARLTSAKGPALVASFGTPSDVIRQAEVQAPLAGTSHDALTAAFIAALGEGSGESWDIAFRNATVAGRTEGLDQWASPWVPVRCSRGTGLSVREASVQLAGERAQIATRLSFLNDLPLRLSATVRVARSRLPGWRTVAVEECASIGGRTASPGPLLKLIIPDDGTPVWEFNEGAVDQAVLQRLAQRMTSLLGLPMAVASEGTPLVPSGSPACVHELVSQAAARHPGRPAVHARGQSLSYAELDRQANRIARYLVSAGVQGGDRVGICLERSTGMLAALLGVLKAGACYLPLDPAYPADRLSFMVRDSGAWCVLVDASTRSLVPGSLATTIDLNDASAAVVEQDTEAPRSVAPDSPAYVMYTSGSTGRPKGVILEHRNVTSFFAAMDDRLAGDEPGTWLAVTSLSFDISVLELLWTLTRGFAVVIGGAIAQGPARRVRHAKIDFSLFYFSGSAEAAQAEQYRLLLEGARFADRHGFSAVWTPERHFHAFGGLYPNPSVTAAAVAAITTQVAVRGGSVVLPLHHPARVAEEWAVVDNLSGGRAGIAFASGWQPNDFVFAPESYREAKTRMLEGIDIVCGLWRGEARTFPGPEGRPVELRTLPRPVQRELPVWLTAAGNPETYQIAGERGYNVLTHLLGQSVDELAEKIRIYRTARKSAGHRGEGRVALMLHTFLAEEDEAARRAVSGPLKDYLRTSVDLIAQFASTFPALRKAGDNREPDFASLTPGELEAVLDYSFERYYETSGLLGTPAKCRDLVARLIDVGVDEIACLIDFGVDTDAVVESLSVLNRLRQEFVPARPIAEIPDDESVAALVERFGVTHLQCTPSLASILLADAPSHRALRGLKRLLVGGEVLPVPLARELCAAVGGSVLNMYGPTETTVWSTTYEVTGLESDRVPIGKPLSNTTVFVADEAGRPVPPGVPGELLIGGAGVARGYHARPELTAERFVERTDRDGPRGRFYRTGDSVVARPDGTLDFLGRIDQQIKIRGHRVELGEIEVALSSHPGVGACAVVAITDPDGDVTIQAHVVPRSVGVNARELKAHLARSLPEVMIPSRFQMDDALPRTPNGKIDRATLRRLGAATQGSSSAGTGAPLSEREGQIARIWCEVLGLDTVGYDDNFFEIGGHSLFAVRVHARLKALIGRELAITDLFRFPTVRALAAYLGDQGAVVGGASSGQARAAARREALTRRRAGAV